MSEARRCTDQLLREYPGSFGALCITAQTAEDEGKLEEAVTRWTRTTELRADHIEFDDEARRNDESRAATQAAIDSMNATNAAVAAQQAADQQQQINIINQTAPMQQQ